MATKSFISGCAGLTLSVDEKAFFQDEQPWGFILFKRNCDTPEQIKDLTASLRETVAHENVPIFIDQEGGRVQRLGPPHWPKYPTGRFYGDLFHKDPRMGQIAAFIGGYLIGHDLIELGINADCLPVLDVPVEGAHDVIGDRAYGLNPEIVAKLGGQAALGALAAGVYPVIKHIPGHGRAAVDSHHELPRVDASREELEEIDFKPFQALCDLPMAMTAHVVYEALDPTAPCSTSAKVVSEVIRGTIGFDGLLMSDDVSMNALTGDIVERTSACFAAGCDSVLHCNGKMDEMQAVAANSPVLTGEAKRRADAVFEFSNPDLDIDVDEAREDFEKLMSEIS